MSDEITKLRGRLAVAQELAEAISLGISVDIDEIRSLADKYEHPVDLKSDRILVAAKRLDDQVKRLRTVQLEIASLLKDLGRI
jgi:hypothetical protein